MQMVAKYLSICLALWLLSGPARAADEILWADLSFPPWMILEGRSAGQGVWDDLQRALIAGLPQYQHRVEVMNNARFEAMAQQGAHVCKVYYFKTPEREQLLHYSLPSVVFLSNEVLMSHKMAAQLGYPASLSLAQLMQDGRWRGSFVKGRSYGKELDSIIQAHMNLPHIRENVSTNESLFRFLSEGRTDYILEFPAVHSFFESDLGLHPDLVSIPIQQAPTSNVTYVTCVRNGWGKAVIESVNPIVSQRVLSPEHRAATLRWYTPKQRAALEQIYDNLLVRPLNAQAAEKKAHH